MPFAIVAYIGSLVSLDYLGFWLYSLFALLVARPLIQFSLSAKIAGITLGVFGILYNGIVIAILAGVIARTQIETYIMSTAGLLLIVMIATLFLFKGGMASTD